MARRPPRRLGFQEKRLWAGDRRTSANVYRSDDAQRATCGEPRVVMICCSTWRLLQLDPRRRPAPVTGPRPRTTILTVDLPHIWAEVGWDNTGDGSAGRAIPIRVSLVGELEIVAPCARPATFEQLHVEDRAPRERSVHGPLLLALVVEVARGALREELRAVDLVGEDGFLPGVLGRRN